MFDSAQELPQATAYHLLSRAAADNGDRTAITFIEDADNLSAQSITYGQFISRVHQFSHLLMELGVGRTDVVSVLCPTVTDSIIAFFSAETVGIVNPINFLLRSEDLVAMMTAVEAKVLVTMGPDTPDIWTKAIYARAHVPSLKHIVAIGPAGDDVISLERALSMPIPIAPPQWCAI
jgi:acyl-CoA synthetase (AMP-forming)/AMP-acid ligase II